MAKKDFNYYLPKEETCPSCGNKLIGYVKQLHCNQCKSYWINRSNEAPKVCPYCGSVNWKWDEEEKKEKIVKDFCVTHGKIDKPKFSAGELICPNCGKILGEPPPS